MLVAEYDYDTDIAVQREESLKIGIQQGIEQGFSDGTYQKAIETAKLMRMHNYPIAEICTISGLSKEEVEAIN